MKWLIAMLVGAASGWLIVSVTDEVAIAASSGAAIGVLAILALFGPPRSFLKVAGAMAIGCLFGWLVACLAQPLAVAMAVGGVVGATATVAVIGTRPVRSLLKVVGAMGVGFAVGWGVGAVLGDHRLGMALTIPLGLALLLLTADTVSKQRRRPF